MAPTTTISGPGILRLTRRMTSSTTMQAAPIAKVRRCVFVEAADQFHELLEELVALERESEHLPQLAANHDQGGAKDVTDQDGLERKSVMNPSRAIRARIETAPTSSASSAANEA